MNRWSRGSLFLLSVLFLLQRPFVQHPSAQVSYHRVAELASIGASVPLGGLVRGSDGAMYGTTSGGGTGNCGTVYRLTPDGQVTLLYSFDQPTGCVPVGDLAIGPDGAFYGVTYYGGLAQPGPGTVYRLALDGTHTVLYDFSLPLTGAHPYAGLTLAPNGLLYGTTTLGSSAGGGVAYTVSPSGDFAVIANGLSSQAALTLGADGFLYGTNRYASTAGSLFRMSLAGDLERLNGLGVVDGLCPQGLEPLSELAFGADGALYGTSSVCGPNADDAGAVFRLGSDGQLSTLHAFSADTESAPPTYSQGAAPWAGLTRGSDGNFYGVTTAGGAQLNGVLYRLSPTTGYTVLHTFEGGEGGGSPEDSPLEYSPGIFYGTTENGTIYRFTSTPNGAPVANDGTLTTAEDTPTTGQLTATDADSDPLTFSLVTSGTSGTATITDTSTGAFTYTPNPNSNGADSFTFRVNDGHADSNIATVTVTITPVNDAPEATGGSFTTDEDVPLSSTLTAADVDGPSLSVAIVTNGTRGTAVVTDPVTGAFTYTPNPNANGTDTFTFQASDGALTSSLAVVTVTIVPIVDVPIARDGVVTTTAGVAFDGALGSAGGDGGAALFAVATPPARGTVTVTDVSTGTFTYTPNAGATGYDSFTFTLQGADGTSTTATQMVLIVAANPRRGGDTSRSSVSAAGTQGNGVSADAVTSADGRYVAFSSSASTLVAGDTNGTEDVFVRDRQAGVTTRVSVVSGGGQSTGGGSGPAISLDGRYVAFESASLDLAPGGAFSVTRVFLHDRQTGQTTLVSVTSNGSAPNGDSRRAVLSADARYVAFDSGASNLVAGDTNAVRDVFVYDRVTGTTTRMAGAAGQANGNSFAASLSADGRYVAVYSSASNLVAGDTNARQDVFVHDRVTGETTLVSRSSAAILGNQASGAPRISPDGRFVAFESSASNLVGGDANGASDIFLHDRATGATTRLSVSGAGGESNGFSFNPSLSADARFVAFRSTASNLVAGDTNNTFDVFVHDRQSGETRRLSVSSDGGDANAASEPPSLSADGRFVSFPASASNLVPGDTNGVIDVFIVGGAAVTPETHAFAAAGGTGTVDVAFVYPGSSWTATSNEPWLAITNQSNAVGNGTVVFSAAPNGGAARTGTLTVAGQAVTVTQSAREVPVITWPALEPIVYGVRLTDAQLNATAGVDGTFVYSPPADTLLNAGADQPLSVTFTPTDTATYGPATATNAITVLPRATITTVLAFPSPSLVDYPVTLIAQVQGFFGAGGQVRFTSSLTGDLGTVAIPPFSNQARLTLQPPAGTHAITATFLGTPNHSASTSASFTHHVVVPGSQFAVGSPVGTGQSPWATAAGDLNGDGHADAVTANGSGQTVGVYLASASGALVSNASYPVGVAPTAVTLADFNGDGRLDVGVVNQQSRSVGVLLGNGDGTLQSMVSSAVANVPRSISAADLNGDGRIDLVAAHHTCCASQVAVLLGNGDGTFQPVVDYASNGLGVAAVGDLDGDGAVDIAFTAESQARVLLNRGDGTFLPGPSHDLPGVSEVLLARELNGDGLADLVVLTQDGVPYVLLSVGGGAFAAPVEYERLNGAMGMAALDADQDGALDLVVPSGSDRTVVVLRNNGDGTFEAGVRYPATGRASVATGDLNGDGAPDFVLGDVDGNTITPYLNRGGAAMAVASAPNPSQAGQSVTITAQVTPTVDVTAVPGGSVIFREGTTVLGTVPVDEGHAALSLATLPTGAHTIVATYAGDGRLNPGATATVTHVVEALPLQVALVAPNGGEKVFIGVPSTIRWTANGATTFDVELSRNAGTTFSPVAGCSGLAGAVTTCTWTPTAPATTSARVRVTARNAQGTVVDVSEANFQIATGAPAITVTAPNTAVSWIIGSTQSLRWNHNLGLVSSVRVELSRDGGASWEVLAASFRNTGASSSLLPWVVTGSASASALLRVTSVETPASDVSNVTFAIVRPTITVTAPNTAVTWSVGSRRTITWTHNVPVGQLVDIDVSRDGGSTWAPVAAGIANTTATTGSFDWVVSGPTSANARIRVRWAPDGAANDLSNVDFAIVAPSILVTAPNTVVTWRIASTQTLRFTHNLGANQPVAFDISRDGGATWTPIVSLTTTTATAVTYAWTVSGPPTATARIRARWETDPAVVDASDVSFAIISRITVTAPNTAVTWGAGSTRPMSWTHNLGTAEPVHIDVSPDAGVTWTRVASDVANATATTGSFTGAMPTHVTSQALVRVSQATDPANFDLSDVTFTLAAPAVTVTAPNTNVNWTIGSTRAITWTHNLGTAERVTVELSRDGGASWSVLASGIQNSGSTSGTFSWVVTGPATTTGRIRVTWFANGAIQDVSNVNFRVQ